ncbi:MAG: phosphate acetyltransferase [Bacteroidales bacterium]|nr:phosphate acetyltransferase [Bacteroidales bacterium]
MDLIAKIKQSARELNKRIVLPEGESERTLLAADKIISESLAEVLIIGNEDKIHQMITELQLRNMDSAEIIDPQNNKYRAEMIDLLLEIRKEKGLTYNEAHILSAQPLYMGPLLIKLGYADGEVSGAENSTGDVLRPAFQIVKTAPGSSVVSGAFLMVLPDGRYGENGLLVFADCAVNPDPTAQQLAEIAISSAITAKNIAGIEPRVAMLSFSTKGSASHPMVDKVVEATKIVKETHPEILIDGEMQADAAIIEAIGQKKAPGSKIAGRANVLVFPDLNSGNIGYKLVQRMANAEAIGPVLQGMAAPINDLSRGCSVDDIVNLVAITANQSK